MYIKDRHANGDKIVEPIFNILEHNKLAPWMENGENRSLHAAF